MGTARIDASVAGSATASRRCSDARVYSREDSALVPVDGASCQPCPTNQSRYHDKTWAPSASVARVVLQTSRDTAAPSGVRVVSKESTTRLEPGYCKSASGGASLGSDPGASLARISRALPSRSARSSAETEVCPNRLVTIQPTSPLPFMILT